ncbi:MAG: hypothetical protein BGO55_17935 [Sphingobacteriales bacterium 50-39]|nr:DUF1259 domain-containing protein [Sphingobacteriales bacterium]OJW59958.1 MAG: hypothetical protein BGO55_17935 [Sphingobacteriales bacterium 50-39]
MKRSTCCILIALLVSQVHAQIDSIALEKAFGKKGTVQGNVYRVTFPRTDLKVTIDGFPVAPGLALTSWVAIHKMGQSSMMMGDFVMLDSEEPKIVAKLVSLGLGVTAIHNHLVNEKPAIKFLHFSGSGEAIKLAEDIKSAFALTGTPLGPSPVPAANMIDWSAVEAVLGTKGKKAGAVLSYSFPRNEKLLESGMEMPPAMGMATGINLQMEGGKAGTTGDFVLLADEVNPVVKALVDNGINVTAIHNHMLYDEPRLFMLHFWGVGDPGKIAAGLKAALDKTNSKK